MGIHTSKVTNKLYTLNISQQSQLKMMKFILSAVFVLALTEAAPGHWKKSYNRPARPTPRIVDVAVGAGSFTTLVKIVSDLGLVDTLKGAKALTVFAPSDAAFAKLPAGTLESLTPDQAKAIVLRHVITAKVPAAAVTTGSVGTIGGENIDLVKTSSGGVQIKYGGNTINVVAADVKASNGVIHVIDSVIV